MRRGDEEGGRAGTSWDIEAVAISVLPWAVFAIHWDVDLLKLTSWKTQSFTLTFTVCKRICPKEHGPRFSEPAELHGSHC